MRKFLIAVILSVILGVTIVAHAVEKDNEIIIAKAKPDGVVAVLDTVRILISAKTAEITYRYLDAAGDPIGDEFTVIITDIEDDPETPEDETDTSFTDSGLEKAVEKLAKDTTKEKLGL